MPEVTLEMIARALVVLKQDLDSLKPIPSSGPITREQAERLAAMDGAVSLRIEGNSAIYEKDFKPYGKQRWVRDLVPLAFPFPLISE